MQIGVVELERVLAVLLEMESVAHSQAGAAAASVFRDLDIDTRGSVSKDKFIEGALNSKVSPMLQ